jgi:hypothetical protein
MELFRDCGAAFKSDRLQSGVVLAETMSRNWQEIGAVIHDLKGGRKAVRFRFPAALASAAFPVDAATKRSESWRGGVDGTEANRNGEPVRETASELCADCWEGEFATDY